MLSSVIHEVYSYNNSHEIIKFWSKVFNSSFKYVVIRDMMPSIKYEHFNLTDINKIREKSDPKYLEDFEKHWGNVGRDFRTLLHWLLKYTYTDNWSRELYENYVPITIETLKKKIPTNWSTIMEEHFIFQPLKDKVKRDFDFDLTEPTHIKMILRNVI